METWKSWILSVTKMDDGRHVMRLSVLSSENSNDVLLNPVLYTDSSTLSQEALSVLDSSLSWYLNQDTGG